MMLRVLTALILLGPATVAFAAPPPKTAKDCEPIKNPMEFNLCLASLSPVRGSGPRRVAPPPGAEEGGPAAEATSAKGGRSASRKSRRRVSTTVGGRGGAGYFYQGGQRYFRYPGGMVVSDAPRGRKQMSFDVKRR